MIHDAEKIVARLVTQAARAAVDQNHHLAFEDSERVGGLRQKNLIDPADL